jgi:hypothetical protein
MFWRIGSALSFLLCASVVSAHDPFVLDARRAAPGSIQLELIELSRAVAPAGVQYRLQAVGMPQGIIFGVFTKDFAHSFHEVAAGFQVDESGNIVSNGIRETVQPRRLYETVLNWLSKSWTAWRSPSRPQRLEEIVLEPGPYPLGAAWEVAIVSSDRAFRAFAKVVPHPITARDGACTISLELISQRGEQFMASGTGFTPQDDVITESRYAGRVIQKQLRISSEGLLSPHVLSHGVGGADRSAHYTVKGHSCNITVEYKWGALALSRR